MSFKKKKERVSNVHFFCYTREEKNTKEKKKKQRKNYILIKDTSTELASKVENRHGNS